MPAGHVWHSSLITLLFKVKLTVIHSKGEMFLFGQQRHLAAPWSCVGVGATTQQWPHAGNPPLQQIRPGGGHQTLPLAAVTKTLPLALTANPNDINIGDWVCSLPHHLNQTIQQVHMVAWA